MINTHHQQRTLPSLQKLERQLQPIDIDRLEQVLVTHNPNHFLRSEKSKAQLMKLARFPEDLICAAYYYYITRIPAIGFGELIKSMKAFIEPEFNYRKQVYNALQNSYSTGDSV